MAFLKRSQIKTVVFKSLRSIADIPSDSESANFNALNVFQKHVYLSSLKGNLNALPYYMNDGTTSFLAYYTVNLMPDSVDDWATVKDCIDWIKTNQRVIYL